MHLGQADECFPSSPSHSERKRDKNYTVAPGDTLFGIAAREYGDGELYPVIARMNNLVNPDLSDVGHHTVVDGESFAGLAARWYGDEHLAIVIAFANDMDPATEPTSGTVLIQPGLNFRLHVAGHTLESASASCTATRTSFRPGRAWSRPRTTSAGRTSCSRRRRSLPR